LTSFYSYFAGTHKIGKACPAGFSVKKHVDGKIVVEVCSTHLGHSQALGDIFLTQEDRNQIAGRMIFNFNFGTANYQVKCITII